MGVPDTPVLWFRANDLFGLADGATVGPWSSAVGVSTATQATNATKQTVGSNICVRFDGADDSFDLSSGALTAAQNVTGVTILAKVKMNALTATQSYAVHLSNGLAAGNDRAALVVNSTGTAEASGRRLDAEGRVFINGGSVGTTAIRVLSGVFDYTNNALFSYLDSVQVGSIPSGAWTGSGNSSNTASVGAHFGTDTGEVASLDLYEVLVYNRVLTAAELAQAQDYLANGFPPGNRDLLSSPLATPPFAQNQAPWEVRPLLPPIPMVSWASPPETASFSGDSTLAVTETTTADGRTQGTSSLTATATITASGQVTGTASLTVTDSITASGQAQGTVSLTETASIAAAGRTEGTASLTETATITPSGRAEGTASLTVTATITATGALDGNLSGTSSLTVTDTITASGQAEGSATRSTTAAITASGRTEGSAALTETAAITPSGETRGTASLSETATIAPSGQTQGTASRSVTASVTASGRTEGSATRSITATITATGNMSAAGTAVLVAAATIAATGQLLTADTAITRITTGSERQRVSTGALRQRVSTGNARQRITTEIG